MTLTRVAIGGVVCLGLLVRGLPGAEPSRPRAEAFSEDRQKREIASDWIARDGMAAGDGWPEKLVRRVLDESGPAAEELCRQFDELAKAGAPPSDPRWTTLYFAACERRRAARLAPFGELLRRIVFTKHYDLGGSHYAYTEGQSDAQRERHFEPGSSLALFEMDGLYGRVRALLDDPGGVIRDPDASPDGRRVLFAWKKSLDEDDYHLYEMTLDDRRVRQITSGRGFADYEGIYLANGDLLFNSTRCVQTVDCWWTEVSNLFIASGDGRYLRQIGFDQVHTNYPVLAPDGRVLYTRWDYNDRGQIFPQGLFAMNPDGTGQTEVYGNNSWFPTAILHARAIPDTSKIVCVLSGHHTLQKGWLAVIDPRRGRQENQGVQLIAPVRDTPAVKVDQYGQSGDQFQYPYPLDENTFLVGFRPEKPGEPSPGATNHFAIYVITSDGRRELLVSDPAISCNQPIPLHRPAVAARVANRVDYRQDTGTVYLHDVYQGPGLAGVPRGSVKQLRVVALEFRAAGVGENRNSGPGGSALISTPISIEGAWDVKRVLGNATVHEDGSACFTVPSRTPLYFQALDEKGQMIQSMRSWTTLQPGEAVSCVGCHENKNTSPPVGRASLAMLAGPRALATPYDPARGFSFIREVQPVLDRHCVRCHYLDEPPRYAEPSTARIEPTGVDDAIRPAFSLKAAQTLEATSRRKWSDAYRALADRRVCDWINVQSAPPMLPPYHAGASQSRLMRLLEDGHHGVRLSESELDRFRVWIDLLVPYCGDYTEAMADEDVAGYNRFLDKRRRWRAEETRNIEELLRERR
jgi:hypothetical protein